MKLKSGSSDGSVTRTFVTSKREVQNQYDHHIIVLVGAEEEEEEEEQPVDLSLAHLNNIGSRHHHLNRPIARIHLSHHHLNRQLARLHPRHCLSHRFSHRLHQNSSSRWSSKFHNFHSWCRLVA